MHPIVFNPAASQRSRLINYASSLTVFFSSLISAKTLVLLPSVIIAVCMFACSQARAHKDFERQRERERRQVKKERENK